MSDHSVHRARALRLGLAALLVAPLLAACGGGGGGTPTLNLYIGKEKWLPNIIGVCNKQAAGRYKIKEQDLPTNPDQQREQLVRRLAAKDSSVDLIGMDVIWTGEFAEAGWIRPYTGGLQDEFSKDVLPGPLKSATYKNQLFGAPLNSNTQLLWYRKSKLGDRPVPQTWDDMIKAAVAMKQKIDMTGARAESATVTFNSLVVSAGGSIIEDPNAGADAKVALPPGPTTEAVRILKDVATSPAAPAALSNMKEDDARLAFQQVNSDAVFMVNYPFVYPSVQSANPELAKDYGWARYPSVIAGKPSAAPLGGYNLGISKFTKHPNEAIEAVRCLRSPANQKDIALVGGQPPTLNSLFDDPDYRKSQPFWQVMRDQLTDAAPRPVTPSYNDISLAVQRELHPFSGIGDPAKKAADLRDLVDKALNSEAVL